MYRNAFLRKWSSVFEREANGYQTSYGFHLKSPVRFWKEIKVTMQRDELLRLLARRHADLPVAEESLPAQRMRVLRDEGGNWLDDKSYQTTSRRVRLNTEM